MKKTYALYFLFVIGLMLGACNPNQLPILPPETDEAVMETEETTEEEATDEAVEDDAMATDEAADEAVEDDAVATDEAAEEVAAGEAVEDGAVATDEAGEEVATDEAAEDDAVATDDAMATDEAADEAVEDAAMATDEAADEAVEDDAAVGGDLMDVLIDSGNFSTLVAAIQEADLYTTFEQEGPLTLFAPTDDAFAALPEGAVETLLADPQGMLTEILLYHVVEGKVMAASVIELDDQYVMTLDDMTFQVVLDGDAVTLYDGNDNTVNVIETDIEASNGVVHVIDAVLGMGRK